MNKKDDYVEQKMREFTLFPVWSRPLSSVISDKKFASLKPEHALLYLLLLLHEGDDLESLVHSGANHSYHSADPIELWWTIAYNMPHLKGEVEAAIKAWVEIGLIDLVEPNSIQLRAHVPYATELDRFRFMSSTHNEFHRRRSAKREKQRLEGDENPK